jgi:hypothetical protein
MKVLKKEELFATNDNEGYKNFSLSLPSTVINKNISILLKSYKVVFKKNSSFMFEITACP